MVKLVFWLTQVPLFVYSGSMGAAIGTASGYFTTTKSNSKSRREENSKMRMENLLGTMKESFLRQLNLSDVPEEHSKISPPQFMMELYQKYASDNSAVPQSDVIRSFTIQDITPLISKGTILKFRLQFNISIPKHERITSAQLQLFFFQAFTTKATSCSCKTMVKVYEVYVNGVTSQTRLLKSNEVKGEQSSWETIDVTTAVQRWIQSKRGTTVFDVAVDNGNCGAAGYQHGSIRFLNMSTSIGDNASAALIVFSDDIGSRKWEAKKELREMMLHEEEITMQTEGDWSQHTQQLPNGHAPRKKRKAEREYCRRTSLKVNFKDIGWDSWIVAPLEYDAFECRGLCYHPLTDESTPSKHALIQTLINIRDPKKANMACCVPIKLDPITVMYQENGRLTIRYLYEEMKVAECGCR
uniref:Growth differentiation factor 2 n=1 Tax=Gouania willdenowi TaxID=441366 RepID=A0A8C5H0L3_GOUWI